MFKNWNLSLAHFSMFAFSSQIPVRLFPVYLIVLAVVYGKKLVDSLLLRWQTERVWHSLIWSIKSKKLSLDLIRNVVIDQGEHIKPFVKLSPSMVTCTVELNYSLSSTWPLNRTIVLVPVSVVGFQISPYHTSRCPWGRHWTLRCIHCIHVWEKALCYL